MPESPPPSGEPEIFPDPVKAILEDALDERYEAHRTLALWVAGIFAVLAVAGEASFGGVHLSIAEAVRQLSGAIQSYLPGWIRDGGQASTAWVAVGLAVAIFGAACVVCVELCVTARASVARWREHWEAEYERFAGAVVAALPQQLSDAVESRLSTTHDGIAKRLNAEVDRRLRPLQRRLRRCEERAQALRSKLQRIEDGLLASNLLMNAVSRVRYEILLWRTERRERRLERTKKRIGTILAEREAVPERAAQRTASTFVEVVASLLRPPQSREILEKIQQQGGGELIDRVPSLREDARRFALAVRWNTAFERARSGYRWFRGPYVSPVAVTVALFLSASGLWGGMYSALKNPPKPKPEASVVTAIQQASDRWANLMARYLDEGPDWGGNISIVSGLPEARSGGPHFPTLAFPVFDPRECDPRDAEMRRDVDPMLERLVSSVARCSKAGNEPILEAIGFADSGCLGDPPGTTTCSAASDLRNVRLANCRARRFADRLAKLPGAGRLQIAWHKWDPQDFRRMTYRGNLSGFLRQRPYSSQKEALNRRVELHFVSAGSCGGTARGAEVLAAHGKRVRILSAATSTADLGEGH
jgi:hypothetical protein